VFFESMSPWRNRVSSALVGAFGSGERRSRLRPRRRASGRLHGIDHLIERLEDRRLLDASPIAHPTFIINNPGGVGPLQSSSPVGFTPAQIQKAYGIDSLLASGNNGAGQTVAIVDAYDDPNIASDLHNFDVQFGLPQMDGLNGDPTFTKVNEYGETSPLPSASGTSGWSEEESLDVEWVHSIAPQANIILVEANSPSYTDLIVNGVANAAKLPGVSAVSMSWGASEFSGETGYDSIFQTPSGHNGVTFLASTGDSGAPGEYPAYSPNVVAVGGTTLTLSNPSGTYGSETGWSLGSDSFDPTGASGGGISLYESKPSYQSVVTQSATQRTNPDVSFDADPATGVAVYDSYDFGASTPWVQVGGTSLSCPSWAGLMAIVNQERVDSGGTTLDGPTQTLPALYNLYSNPATYTSDFHDITTGNNGFSAGTGYDLVTGIGTPIANQLVPALATHSPAITSASSTTFTVGQAGSFTVTTTGFPTPTLTERGALPSGVTFVDNKNGTATLRGTTTAAGTYPLTFTAANGVLPQRHSELHADGHPGDPGAGHHQRGRHDVHDGRVGHVHGDDHRLPDPDADRARCPAQRRDVRRQQERHGHAQGHHDGGWDLPPDLHRRQRRAPQRHSELHADGHPGAGHHQRGRHDRCKFCGNRSHHEQWRGDRARHVH